MLLSCLCRPDFNGLPAAPNANSLIQTVTEKEEDLRMAMNTCLNMAHLKFHSDFADIASGTWSAIRHLYIYGIMPMLTELYEVQTKRMAVLDAYSNVRRGGGSGRMISAQTVTMRCWLHITLHASRHRTSLAIVFPPDSLSFP